MSGFERAVEYFAESLQRDTERKVEALRAELAELRAVLNSAPRGRSEPAAAYLNQREAAEFLGCSSETIRRRRLDGDFPEPVRLGSRNLRWSRADLERWAEENSTGA